jgi:septal ring factor EnvC (AmiA/AmiB activator)
LVKGWLDQAEITDLGEDYRFRNRQGDELPAWVANKAERMQKIREAKAALEQEAADKAKEDENKPKNKNKKKDDDEDPPPPPKPEPKAQRNFTDQTGHGLPPVPAEGPRQGQGRVAAGLHGPSRNLVKTRST